MSLSAKLAQRYRSLANAGIRNRAMEQLEHNLKIFRQEVGKPLAGEISYNKRNAKGKVIIDRKTGQPKKEYKSLGMPKGLTPEQQFTYESIVLDFLEDPSSSRRAINKQFNEVQKLREAARRTYLERKIATATRDPKVLQDSVDKLMEKWKIANEKRIKNFSAQQKSEDVDIYNRMQKEVAIKEIIGSDQYQDMWTLAKVNKIGYHDMLEALYAVTVPGAGGDVSITELLNPNEVKTINGTMPGGTLLDNESISIITGENDSLKDIQPPEEWTQTAQLEDAVLNYLYNVMEVNR